jgi:hypothetical protein
MPEEFQAFGESWKTFHPDWKFSLWTDANRPTLRNEAAYLSARSFADKANILRYEILLTQGGVYIDTDFECRKSIEQLIAKERCFAARQWEGAINNAIIGAVPEHPALRALVSGLTAHIETHSIDLPSVFRSGPFYFGPVIRRFKSVKIFPPELFYPYDWHERWKRHHHFDQAYAVHHWTLSGRTADQPKKTAVGSKDTCCAHVVIVLDETCDEQRLIWALEGLCLQTAANFDVSILSDTQSDGLERIVRSYDKRLQFALANFHGDEATFERVLEGSRAPVTVLLHANCVPDPDFLRDAVSCGVHSPSVAIPRFYPARKFYEFKLGWPLDYDGLRIHSLNPKTRSDRFSSRHDYVTDRYFGVVTTNSWVREHLAGHTRAPLTAWLLHLLAAIRNDEEVSILSSKCQITCLCAARTYSSRAADKSNEPIFRQSMKRVS